MTESLFCSIIGILLNLFLIGRIQKVGMKNNLSNPLPQKNTNKCELKYAKVGHQDCLSKRCLSLLIPKLCKNYTKLIAKLEAFAISERDLE